jgi:hypothetical protein
VRRCLLLATVLLAVVAASASGATATQVHFKTPSGNINCIGGVNSQSPAFVECQQLHAAWAHAPVKPKGCDLDFEPHNLALEGRRVVIGACRGDIGPLCEHNCTTLAYGKSVSIGPIRCRSALNGVTCRYVSGKLAGFRIARQGYVVWRR